MLKRRHSGQIVHRSQLLFRKSISRLCLCAPQRLSRRKCRLRTSDIVPDILVETRLHKRLIEAKPSRRLHKPDTVRKFSVARLYALQNKRTFHVVTEQHLSRQPLLDNVRQLSCYSGFQPDHRLVNVILDSIRIDGTLVGQLARQLNQPDPVVTWHILYLLAIHQVSGDLVHHALNADDQLYPEGVVEWDPFESAWALHGSLTDGPGGSSASLMQNDWTLEELWRRPMRTGSSYRPPARSGR